MSNGNWVLLSVGVALSGLLVTSTPSVALDINDQPIKAQPPAEIFKDVRAALRAGVRDLHAGNKVAAARALQFAAQGGNMAAQYKLGRMYAEGDGVPHDDFKAFKFFSAIANNFADEGPDSINAFAVSKALVALGSYYLEGIAESPIKASAERAFEMFRYAAVYFANADAQYNLGRMHLDGAIGPKDPQSAARWLRLAAEKNHVYAQAVLGQMLFTGNGIPRQAPLGLMWLHLASDGADAGKDQWVLDLYKKANAAATDDERKVANKYLSRQRRAVAATPADAPAAEASEVLVPTGVAASTKN
jgi:TPR repeat protein